MVFFFFTDFGASTVLLANGYCEEEGRINQRIIC